MDAKILYLASCAILVVSGMTFGGSLKAPPGLFKDLNDSIVGDAIILNGKQLFVDDYIIEELTGAEKVLNQPVKHPDNPLIVPDRPWESQKLNRGSVLYDESEQIFKMWYPYWRKEEQTADGWEIEGVLAYATSRDGIAWDKPIINPKGQNNLTDAPIHGNPPGVFKDPADPDPRRRYKMMYGEEHPQDRWVTSVAYSPDGIHWTAEPENPVVPHSDTLCCPYWDNLLGNYVAYIRFGPPNVRLIARIQSEDFVHWSPKVTVIGRTKIDGPFSTNLYGMAVLPYEDIYIGLLEAYHGETIKPIPDDKLWMDKSNTQLTFSRNGLTWMRVGSHGAIPHRQVTEPDHNWQAISGQATFLPYGEHGRDWDWGSVYAFQPPLVVGDQIWIYYWGAASRHWGLYYHGDPESGGYGLATLRLDGFVSVDAAGEGTLTTKAIVFIGDEIEVNADGAGGSILVEALDPDGNVIEGFSKEDCAPLTTDSVRHVLKWRGSPDCHLIQAMPIKLRFYLDNAKLYSFTPRIRHRHYVPSYD